MHHRSSRHGKDGIFSNRVVGGVGWVSGGRNNGSEAFALVDKVLYSCLSILRAPTILKGALVPIELIGAILPSHRIYRGKGRQHSGQRSALCMPK